MEEVDAGERRKVVPTLTLPTEEPPVFDDQALDDASLAAAAAGGDQRAFTVLLRRHDDKMRGVVWRVVDSTAAMDDVLQDAYLKAWQALGGWRGESAFSTWLYSIVYRSAIDWTRRQRRLRSVSGDGFDASTPDHAQRVVDDEALRAALATLSPDHLAVVTLIDGEGRSYSEVATMLDASEGTIASRLNRARTALREQLGGRA